MYFYTLISGKTLKKYYGTYSFCTKREFMYEKSFKPGEKVYFAYFGVWVGDQDTSWAPHRVCSSFVEGLCMWSQGKVESFRFGAPMYMIWMELQNHSVDCQFLFVQHKEVQLIKSKRSIFYTNLESALRHVPYGPDILTPLPPERLGNP